MLSSAAQTVRNLGRYRQIVQVLLKYGFRELIAQLRLDSLPGMGGSRSESGESTRDESAQATARRVRLAMVDLGPPFIKLGQILSVRADLVPPAYQQEFQKLQHEVPPFGFAEARAIVEGELGATLEELFDTFDPEPVAAASIAQVHRATLPTGERVAVKVQRPGIRRQLETDIRILYDLAGLVERYLPEQTDLVDPTAAVGEFARMVRQELDFEEEGRHMTRFNDLFREWPEVQAPTVYPSLTAGRVLTMSFLDGIPLGNTAALDAAGHDRLKLAERVVEIGVREVFGFGFFHADPHPGNLLALDGDEKNRIGLLDFGIVGRMDDDLRDAIARLLVALTTGDDAAATDVLVGLSPEDGTAVDRAALGRDIRGVLDRYRGKERHEIDLSALLGQMMELIRRYRLRVPPDLILMFKCLITGEGTGRVLAGDGLDVLSLTLPHAEKLVAERLNPLARAGRRLVEAQGQVDQLARLPADLRSLVRLLSRGETRITVEHVGLDRSFSRMERSLNRLGLSVLLGCAAIAAALLLRENGGSAAVEHVFVANRVLGLTLLTATLAVALWLIFRTLRRS